MRDWIMEVSPREAVSSGSALMDESDQHRTIALAGRLDDLVYDALRQVEAMTNADAVMALLMVLSRFLADQKQDAAVMGAGALMVFSQMLGECLDDDVAH